MATEKVLQNLQQKTSVEGGTGNRGDNTSRESQNCRVTSLRIIDCSCISWIGVGGNYAAKSFTFGLHSPLTPVKSVTFKMIMIAFITLNSSLVPFIESLCRSNP